LGLILRKPCGLSNIAQPAVAVPLQVPSDFRLSAAPSTVPSGLGLVFKELDSLRVFFG